VTLPAASRMTRPSDSIWRRLPSDRRKRNSVRPPDASFDRLAEDRFDALAVLGVDLLEGVRSRLNPVVGGRRSARRAVVDAPALGVDQGDQVSDVLRDQPEPLFAFAQLLLGAPVLGDVAETPHPADRLPLDELGSGIALEDAAVAELDRVEALQAGMRVELRHLLANWSGSFS